MNMIRALVAIGCSPAWLAAIAYFAKPHRDMVSFTERGPK